MPEIPNGFVTCAQTPKITMENMPKDLPPLPGSVKSCVWMRAGAPVTIEPQTKYSVEMMGADACFTIEFFSKTPEASAASLPKALMNPRAPTSAAAVAGAVAVVLVAGVAGYYYYKSRK